MRNSNRVPAGVPAGGQFAADQRAEATVHLDSSTDSTDGLSTARFGDLPGPKRVAMTQGFLYKARIGEHMLSAPETQAAARQINAEAHYLMTRPENAPLPAAGEVEQAAADHIADLATHQIVPAKPTPMDATRVEQIADYFTARARQALAGPDGRAAYQQGPTPTRAVVDGALGIVAALREPEASRYAQQTLRDQMRHDILDLDPDPDPERHSDQTWHAVDADDRWPGKYVAYTGSREDFTLRITPGDNDSYEAPGFQWRADNGHDSFSGYAKTVAEAQDAAVEAADYVISGEADLDHAMALAEADL